MNNAHTLHSLLNIIMHRMVMVETMVCEDEHFSKTEVSKELKFCYGIIERCRKVLDKAEVESG